MLNYERVVLYVAALCARRLDWSPIGKRVLLIIRQSRDLTLEGQTLRGVIRATSPDADGIESKAIIELDAKLNYFGHYRRGGLESVRTAPARRWQSLDRLLVLPASVRLIDCDADDDGTQDRVIAFATMRLDRGGRR